VLSAGYYDAYYLKAQKVRSLIKRDFDEAYEKVDAILTPATPTPAFALGSQGGDDPIAMYLNDIFTVTVNMAGLPGLVVPAGFSSEGLPLGLQIIGKPFDEALVLRTGQAIEDAVGRTPMPEPWWIDCTEAGAKKSAAKKDTPKTKARKK
jgi:aspartyl-tRNA(Asn)/glutamyl-tRNA(Gln) amidotransferase subunit A